MPTPSEHSEARGEWTARTEIPRRSVFGNYRAETASVSEDCAPSVASGGAINASEASAEADQAVARAFIYRWLAKAYEDPTAEGWAWLNSSHTRESLQCAIDLLSLDKGKSPFSDPEGYESFHSAYLAAFGHAARGSCPLNEIEYGDIKADPLFQPHRLADLAAFYSAFGLEIADDAGERHDHISLELEFMCVLAAKGAYALSHEGRDSSHAGQCRDAQKKFLREHLGRWVPAFARRLTSSVSETSFQKLGEFTRMFVEAECARFGVSPGSEDLLLRPVDDAAESLCGSCGIANPLPGA